MFRPRTHRPLLRSSIAALAVAVATLAPVRSAYADEEGTTGRIVRLTVNTQSSDKYASFHGSITLKSSGATKPVTYFWGGSTCPAQHLADAEVALLATTLLDRRTFVAPRYRTGEGARGARCLVAFELVAS
jgi:hypothetical protein